ncbi:MAG: membrane protein insertion efficiency factor YidD [Spirochaetes bacterium]|nr:membrane protein insertion efficiency factor YidD [Spirochaetota bacterium]MCK5268800.1 membrane protein insertion efficiency factor YidD [Spirochaetota bacterium]
MFKKVLLLIRWIFILPIIIYKKIISPHLPNSCIYSHSCSSYSKDAVLKHGIIKGSILAITRILRCIGLFFSGGYDPVPEKFSFKYIFRSYKEFWRHKRKKK